MKAAQLETSNPNVLLIEPSVERDASFSLSWLEGELGRNTLSLMGVVSRDNVPSSLEKERGRIKDFIEREGQLNWMVQLNNRIVGSIWVDLEPVDKVPAPAIHIMIGDYSTRGQGVGSASTRAVVDYLREQGHEAIFSRTLVNNTVASKLLKENGFQPYGEAYTDSTGLEWQNVQLSLSK